MSFLLSNIKILDFGFTALFIPSKPRNGPRNGPRISLLGWRMTLFGGFVTQGHRGSGGVNITAKYTTGGGSSDF